MEPAGVAPDLDGGERRCGSGEAAAEEEADGANEGVTEAAGGVDLDGDGGGLAAEEVGGDAEEKLLVPRGVLAAYWVGPGAELEGRVDPRDGVGLHAAAQVGRRGFEALGGNQVDL